MFYDISIDPPIISMLAMVIFIKKMLDFLLKYSFLKINTMKKLKLMYQFIIM